MARAKRIEDPVTRELDAIKRLLILQLYKSGVSQADVARALSIDAGDLSRIVPARALTSKHGKKSIGLKGEAPDDA
jgi:hypothetical protein